MQAWRDHAACLGADTEIFFPRKDSNQTTWFKQARAFCDVCTVRTECLEYALSFPTHEIVGIWGGTSVRQRLKIHNERMRYGYES